ncbi:MAG: tagatose 1,6-diphosphate aldolase [Chloroflexi bacterium]|nr:tagatose 1,6-diphosphate aldolase [Chloroflexota bacterium]
MTAHRAAIGKDRALQRASTADGLFTILAIDHQDALRRALNPEAPGSVSAAEMVGFKRQVVRSLIDDVSGVLLDPIYGAFQAVADRSLGAKGLLVELEKADYQMAPLPLAVEINPGWSVANIKQMNADGVKLFFYYNPHATDHARRQEAIVGAVAADCARLEIPFYAEPIVYRDSDQPTATTSGWLVADAAYQISQFDVDVLKLEFPVDMKRETDPAVWRAACEAITQAINVPWVLLSAGVTFDLFAQQLEVACKAGASGFMVGRALWGEAAQIADVAARQQWLQQTGRKRLQLLSAIATAYGSPWFTRRDRTPPAITPATFRQYPNLGAGDDG